MKLAFSSISALDRPLAEAAQLAAEAGLHGLEVTERAPHLAPGCDLEEAAAAGHAVRAAGLEVVAFGAVSVYEPRGDYQLVVTRLEPKGLGALQLAFERLKEKLRKEGLFDPERKRPLPSLPRRIGVVTSSTGAAVRDIVNVILRRFPKA